MKLRTDFVTNSSSSSFIFEKGVDIEEVKERAIQKHKEVYGKQKNEGWRRSYDYYESLYERGDWILQHLETEVTRISQLEAWPLRELYNWYGSDVLEQKFAKEPEDKSRWSQAGREFAYLCLYIEYLFYIPYYADDVVGEKGEINTKAVYESFQWEYVDFMMWSEDNVRDFLENEYNEIMAYFEKMSQKNVCLGELMEQFFDSEYVLYNDMESPPFMSDALKETKGCLWGCNHMG